MILGNSLATLYAVFYAGTAVLTVGLGYWVLSRTEMGSRRWFGLLMGLLSFWALVSFVGVFVPDRQLQELLLTVWTVVGLSTVFAWLAFVVDYTDGDPLESRLVRVFALACLGLVAVAVTLPFHDLYYSSVLFRTEPFAHVETTVGPGRVAALGYTFSGVGLGTYYLLELFVSTRYRSRTQALVLVAGIVLGILPFTASLVGVTPVPTYNHTVFGIATFVLVVTYAVFRHSFADFAPIARDIVVAEIEDPLFIIDSDTHLVDYNDAAGRAVRGLDSHSIGTPVSALVDGLSEFDPGEEGPEMVSLTVDGESRHYSVQVSEVTARPSPRGYLILLRDITEQTIRERELEAARQELERSNERLEEFASVVSHDLRNPLNVASLRLDMAQREVDSDHLDTVDRAHDRIESLVEDLLLLARSGTGVDEQTRLSLATVADDCWQTVETADATLRSSVSSRSVQTPPGSSNCSRTCSGTRSTTARQT
ncbi:MAG: His Kinase A (phosphoacceptor) domain protein [halophilic archaeon J07HX64]|nr:MAG: His Kinase A (phosphoacceptor) domain protein [halophilic archaeon J07HX64]